MLSIMLDADTPPPTSPLTPAAVLDFWFADGLQTGWPSKEMKDLWFGGGPALDDRVRSQFGEQVVQAIQGGLGAWEMQPLSRLALVLLIDQFTRNVFRSTAQAFAGDGRAQHLVTDALALGWDQHMPYVGRVFLYMPLMHAENLALQNECVSRFTQLLTDAPEPLKARLQGNLDFAVQHREIIARFGRFPHRNLTMDRPSTKEELVFLQTGPRFGQ